MKTSPVTTTQAGLPRSSWTATTRPKSEVIVELLEPRLTGTDTERTTYELAQEAGFIGCLGGNGTSKSAGKGASKSPAGSTKERVAAAIRKKHGR